MAVYAKNGDSFEFTDRAIKVTGTLEFGDYTDEYGYEYGYRITDATYNEVDMSEMSDKMKLWQQLALQMQMDLSADFHRDMTQCLLATVRT